MAEVVDSIIAELIVRDNGYVAGFDKATAAHERFVKSVPKVAGGLDLSGAEAQKYANRHKKAANEVAAAEEAATAKVVRTRKARTDNAVASDEKEVRSAKAAAKIKADAEIAEAARSARYRRLAEQAVTGRGVPQSTSGRIGARFTPEASGQRSIPASVMAGAATEDVAAEAEINHLLAEQALLRSGLATASKEEARVIRDQLGAIRLENELRRAGVAEADIMLALEERSLRVEAERAIVAKKGGQSGTVRGAEQFARGAGAYAALGGPAAIAGLATAAGVAIGAEVISSAIAYGKALENMSNQLGITVEDLQAYQKIARDDGVTTEQLTSAFGHFSAELGRAQQGGEEQVKLFKALGVNVKDFASAGDALPTLIDRISSIKDPAQRAAVETRAFGEQGRRLDALLSGGSASVSELARSLQETGQALSAQEIKDLDNTARKLADVKNQLSVDLSRIVAGNSDAIIGLANSFGILANSILNTIQKLQQFGAEQIRASSLASPDDKGKARQFLMSSRTGRIKLFGNATREMQQVQAGNMKFSVAPGAPNPEAQRAARLAQLDAERQEIARAEHDARATPTAPVQGGVVNTGLLSHLGAPKGAKGKSADALAKEAEAREKRFNDQIASFEETQLRSMEEMTGDIAARADIEKKLADRALVKQLDDIKSQERENVLSGANAATEAARAKALAIEAQKVHDGELQAIEQRKQLDMAQAETIHAETALQLQSDQLSSLLGLAKTAKDRRIIELRLLDLAQQEEKARLEGIIKSSKPGDPAIADAQAQINALPSKRAAAQAEISQRDAGPWRQYLQSLPSTANQIEEAFEHAAVNGVERLNSSLATSLAHLTGLNGEAADFLAQLIEIGIQAAESVIFGGGQSGGEAGGGGGFIGSISSGLGSIFGGARAGGGAVTGGKAYLVGEHGPEIVHMGGSGNVYPNGALPNLMGGGGGGTTIHQSFVLDARFGITTPELLQHVNTVASQRAAEAGQASYRASVAAAPGAITKYRNEKG